MVPLMRPALLRRPNCRNDNAVQSILRQRLSTRARPAPLLQSSDGAPQGNYGSTNSRL
jgi:hypothetical protein